MMSDHAVQRSDSDEDLKLLYRIPNTGESSLPSHSQWMSHFQKQTCISSSSQGCEHHVVSDAGNQGDHKKEQGYLPVERMKSREAKMLSIDLNRSTFECITTQRSNPGELNPTSGAIQSAEVIGAEKDKFNFISNSVARKNICPFDSKAVLSSKLPLQPQLVSSLIRDNFTTDHFGNSENLSSKWEHFPMFDINRKIKSILAPKKKPGHGTMSVGMSEPHFSLSESTLSPHVIKFASEDHFESHTISNDTHQGMRPREPIKGLLTYRDDLAGSSHSEVHKFKCHSSNMRSGLYIKEGNNTYGSYQKHFASSSFTHLNHGLCNRPSPAFLIPEMKNDSEMIATSFGSSCLRLKDESMQVLRDSCPGDMPSQYIDRESGKAIQNSSVHDLLPVHKSIHGSTKLDSSVCVQLSHKTPKCFIHDVEPPGVCTTLNSLDNSEVAPQNFSNATQYLWITKKMGIGLSHGDQMIRESTISAEAKGAAFFNMSTLPTMSHCHGQHVANLEPPAGLRSGEDSGDGVGIDTHFMETLNGSSDKTGTLYINASQIPNSAGLTSSISQKDVVCPNLTKFESTTASPIRQAFLNNPTCVSNRVLSSSRTESMDVDQNLSNFEKPDNIKSLTGSVSIPEQSSIWVKRLRRNRSDSLTPSTKRFKTGDASYSGKARNLSSRMLQYHKSNSIMSKLLEEPQESDNELLLTKDGESSSMKSKPIYYWMRRWCHRGQQAAPHSRRATPVLCRSAPSTKLAIPIFCKPDEPNHSKIVQEDFEGNNFPSITAMALMGKATKKFHPCKFRRKGSCVVWNIEGF